MKGLRSPQTVMRLARLGASHQTRLSFMRVLLRKLRQEDWRFDRPLWKIDDTGTGHAVYRMTGPRRSYSLVAFAHDLPDDMRSDRVIAERWDATFALFDGTPEPDDIARLAQNVPLQEAGRVSDRELVLSRANRSVRLWDYVVDCLAQGLQPDAQRLAEVGYLMRTTAVYGSGKFGAADHTLLTGRRVMGGPFRAEMLTVWLIRTFVSDLVEHMARAKGKAQAVVLGKGIRRALGIGNSTGLGMAPFLVNHPTLLSAWISARETALARVRAQPEASPSHQAQFVQALARAQALVLQWRSGDAALTERLRMLRADLVALKSHLQTGILDQQTPWDTLIGWAEGRLSIEGQELLVSLVLEPHGDLVDDLADTMSTDEASHFAIDGTWLLADVTEVLERHYGWALGHDYNSPAQAARFWYVSESKMEPRLGERFEEAGAAREQPLDVARQAANLHADLAGLSGDQTVATFLEEMPSHRRMVRRLQLAPAFPYAEIQDSLITQDLSPVDMLRCKLAFFGATRFDPRSDRWLRITMFQNAPFPQDLSDEAEDDWVYPAAEVVA